MLAAVTEGVGEMRVREVPEPGDPGPGELVVAPDAVGLCGSDYHFFDGGLTEAAGGGRFPRVQGHEVSAIVEAAGDGCEIEVGQRVALWPLTPCGHCYPCRVGRSNVCTNFRLIGIHVDGGLQERLTVAADHAFGIDATPELAALVEPVSIAVRAVRRGRIAAGERVVILGAGPIGQSLSVAARDRGAEVLLVDRVASRLELGVGAETLVWDDAEQVVSDARDWADGDGPAVVIDATGAAPAVRAAVDMVASAGRVVQVGMAGDEVPLRIGSFTEKELDVLGVCCCGGGEFGEAVELVERRRDELAPLVTHSYPLARAPEAIAFAMEHPVEVMKVVITGGAD
jgi:threonine dehydrogenase-like Zn-dependent dehydrogenase